MRDAAKSPRPPCEAAGELSARDRAILDFERDWRQHEGAKERQIRDRFEISPARYYQLLARLIDLPAAREHDPLLLARLRRRRTDRGRRRAAEALGHRVRD
jgi:hypothetical protein